MAGLQLHKYFYIEYLSFRHVMVAIGILTALYVGGGVREPVVAWPTSHQFPVTHDE